MKTLTVVELRSIFMKQSRMWPHAEPMVPVDWDSTHYLRRVFSKQVMNRSVREMADYWVQQSMQQGLTPPRRSDRRERCCGSLRVCLVRFRTCRQAEVDDTVNVVKVSGLKWD